MVQSSLHLNFCTKRVQVAGPARFELATPGLGGLCPILARLRTHFLNHFS
jgi:hypothetical protein